MIVVLRIQYNHRHTKIRLMRRPDFVCENRHVINVSFIKIDIKSLLDDVYGRILVEDYKKLHDRLIGGDDYG